MTRISSRLLVVVLLAVSTWVAAAEFRRGDVNGDGTFDLSDPVAELGVLFLGLARPECSDVLDVNDDGLANISDAVYALSFLFLGGPEPPPPFPDCGTDTTEDSSDCASFPSCSEEERCFDQSDLDTLLEEIEQAPQCIVESFGEHPLLSVLVCPQDRSPGCAESAGCPLEFTDLNGRLHLGRELLRIEYAFSIPDMPLDLVGGLFPEGVECDTSVEMSLLIDIPLELDVVEGGFEVFDFGDASVRRQSCAFMSSGDEVCLLLNTEADLFCDTFEETVAGNTARLLDELGIDLRGLYLCSE